MELFNLIWILFSILETKNNNKFYKIIMVFKNELKIYIFKIILNNIIYSQ